MAPELLGNRPYQPQVVDWYAFGVILFMLGSGHAPFTKADLNDPHFFCIAKGDMKRFWLAHEQNMSEGFSEEFKDLISSMLAYQPFQRLSAADIVFHPFFTNGGCAT
jgi:BR serine/threonine kinase